MKKKGIPLTGFRSSNNLLFFWSKEIGRYVWDNSYDQRSNATGGWLSGGSGGHFVGSVDYDFLMDNNQIAIFLNDLCGNMSFEFKDGQYEYPSTVIVSLQASTPSGSIEDVVLEAEWDECCNFVRLAIEILSANGLWQEEPESFLERCKKIITERVVARESFSKAVYFFDEIFSELEWGYWGGSIDGEDPYSVEVAVERARTKSNQSVAEICHCLSEIPAGDEFDVYRKAIQDLIDLIPASIR
ncbi:hypothetical protein KJ785_00805 [Patescibacteria group bacterium]|nr:hypothetical protein [Patescibacteria group bacterium]